MTLSKQERVDKGIETDGSNLSGVSAKCAWDDLSRPPEDDEDSRSICIGTQPRRLSGKGGSCRLPFPQAGFQYFLAGFKQQVRSSAGWNEGSFTDPFLLCFLCVFQIALPAATIVF